jgi:predicted dehydrogenase
MLRLGIVGCGKVTTMFHLRAIEDVEGLEVAAVADMDGGRMEDVRRKAGAERGYLDYLELLSDPDVDIVAVNTPPPFHEEMTLRSLEAGKHVLCEKPLAQSAEGCLHIGEVARAAGLRVLPVHNYFYTPCLEKAEALLSEGEIGDIQRIKLRFENNLRSYGSRTDFRLRQEHGIVEDILPHVLTVIQRVAGPVERIESARGWKESYDVVDNLSAAMTSEGGVELDCFMNWTSLIPSLSLELSGSGGRIRMELMKRPYRVEIESKAGKRVMDRGGLGKYLEIARFKHPGFRGMYEHLVGLVEGSQEPMFTAEDEARILALIEETKNLLKPI